MTITYLVVVVADVPTASDNLRPLVPFEVAVSAKTSSVEVCDVELQEIQLDENVIGHLAVNWTAPPGTDVKLLFSVPDGVVLQGIFVWPNYDYKSSYTRSGYIDDVFYEYGIAGAPNPYLAEPVLEGSEYKAIRDEKYNQTFQAVAAPIRSSEGLTRAELRFRGPLIGDYSSSYGLGRKRIPYDLQLGAEYATKAFPTDAPRGARRLAGAQSSAIISYFTGSDEGYITSALPDPNQVNDTSASWRVLIQPNSPNLSTHVMLLRDDLRYLTERFSDVVLLLLGALLGILIESHVKRGKPNPDAG